MTDKLCQSTNFLHFELTGNLSLIHISEPTRLLSISYAVFCLKKTKQKKNKKKLTGFLNPRYAPKNVRGTEIPNLKIKYDKGLFYRKINIDR